MNSVPLFSKYIPQAFSAGFFVGLGCKGMYILVSIRSMACR